MKKWAKKVIVLVTAAVMAMVPVMSASAGASSAALVWRQDAKGWWIERPDGTYLISEWYRSPESGLWYYMGLTDICSPIPLRQTDIK